MEADNKNTAAKVIVEQADSVSVSRLIRQQAADRRRDSLRAHKSALLTSMPKRASLAPRRTA
jgi:hypothetical protein